MFALSLKNLAAHKLRLVGTAVAVLLGVALMTGTLVFNDTLGATFDDVVADANAGIDAAVRAPSPIELGYGQSGPRLDPGIAATIADVDGVDEVAVQVFGYAQLVGADGDPVGDLAQAPAFGVNWVESATMNPYELVEGAAPRTGDEIVIDRAMSGSTGFGPGDEVTVLSVLEPRQFTVSGVATFGRADSAAGATSILFSDATALELFSPDGQVDAVTVTGAADVSQRQLADAIAEALDRDDVEVVTGAEVVAEDQAAFAEGLAPLEMFMTTFAFVALFVGAFIINNTFSITVAQRSKEMAVLRAIGAGRGQVLRSVLAEATLTGVIASGAGVVAGVGVASGLKTLMAGSGFDLPDGPTVITTSSLVTAFCVGVFVTVASAILPARRAGRIRPIAALRDTAIGRAGVSRRRAVLGAASLGIGATVLLVGLGGSDLAVVGLGALVTLIAAAVLAPVIADRMTGIVGAPLALTGISGEVATRNAQRSATRTARTASSLMIGVALISFVTILAASFHTSFASSLEQDYRGTHVIDTGAYDGRGGLSHELAETLRSTPGVDTVMAARVTSGEVGGNDAAHLDAFDVAAVTTLFDLGSIEGDIAGLGVDGIAVGAQTAASRGWTLGTPVTLALASGDVPVRVEAIYGDEAWVGEQFVSTELLGRSLPNQLDYRIYVQGEDAAVRDAAAPYSAAEVLDVEQFGAWARQEIDEVLGIIYALLALAILISLFGIANTLALSVFERTRELGLLRAVGMTRRQVRRTVRGESAVIAVFGTILGIGVGTFFGWAVVRALADQGIDTLTLPVTRLAVIAVSAAVAAQVAAALPARRASRLDVLGALQAS